MPLSYRSPRTEVRPSPIHGRGLFATRSIRRGEIVAVKGGHVFDRRSRQRVARLTGFSFIQIEEGLYIGARRPIEVKRNKLFINHSCHPNLGIRGQITFVARRDIAAGEELTYDWAMEENAAASTRCTCGARNCRKVLTGQDWKIPGLQRRYRGHFSAYLAAKIAARRLSRSRR